MKVKWILRADDAYLPRTAPRVRRASVFVLFIDRVNRRRVSTFPSLFLSLFLLMIKLIPDNFRETAITWTRKDDAGYESV